MNQNLIFYSFYSILIISTFSVLVSCNSNKSKPVYYLFENIEITDTLHFNEYKKNVLPVVKKFGGTYIVAGKPIEIIEGKWRPKSLVIIKFPSIKMANKWYYSEDYKFLKTMRKSSGKFNAVVMESL
jgi:uncharacterized protein (DUF1330 family)